MAGFDDPNDLIEGLQVAPGTPLDPASDPGFAEFMSEIDEAAQAAAPFPGTDFTPEELDRILKACLHDFKEAEDYVRPWRTQRIAAYKAYHCAPQGNERQGRSRYIEPSVYQIVEAIMPELMSIFAAGDRFLELKGRGPEDDLAAESMGAVVDWQLQIKNNGFLLIYRLIKDALLYPNAYCETGWNKVVEPQFTAEMPPEAFLKLKADPEKEVYEFEPVEEWVSVPPAVVPMNLADPFDPEAPLVPLGPEEPYPKLVGFRNVKWGKIKHNHPQAVAFHPGQFYLAKGSTSIADAPFAAREFKKSFSFLKAREWRPENPSGIYVNLDAVRSGALSDDHSQEQEDEERQVAAVKDQQFTIDDQPTTEQPDYGLGRTMVSILRCWPELDLKGDGTVKRYLVEIVNRKTLVRCELLPFKHGEVPVFDLKAVIDPHQHAGVSMSTLLLQLQNLMSALTRQVVDNAEFINSGFWEVSRGAKVDISDVLNVRPKGVLFCDGEVGKGVKRHEPGYFGDKALMLLQHFDDRIEKKTGVTAYNQGMDSESLNKTARGIQAIMTQSQKKLLLIAQILADGFKPLVRHFVSLNQQFLTRVQEFRVLGDQTVSYDPQMMDFDYDIIPAVGLGTGNKEQRIGDAQANVQMLMTAAPVLMPMGLLTPRGLYNAFEDLYKVWGRRDASRYLEKPMQALAAAGLAGGMMDAAGAMGPDQMAPAGAGALA